MIDVLEIEPGNILFKNPNLIIIDRINYDSNSILSINGKEYNLSDVDGIPVTPQLLEKMKLNISIPHRLASDYIFRWHPFGFGVSLFSGTSEINRIRHLHTLQNIYRGLTGKSLELLT